ncbi:hypothetical protein AKO1_002352 [Acrasis kona]|uniref:Senescence domain-containing protein n=1 Tax=Acrasis kona TaxID=1008807 RepID=A0AAW2ZQX3_9EUKA
MYLFNQEPQKEKEPVIVNRLVTLKPVTATKDFPVPVYYEKAIVSLVAYDIHTYNTLQLKSADRVIVFETPFTSDCTILKRTITTYEVILKDERHVFFDVMNADYDSALLFETICTECNVKFVALEGDTLKEAAEQKRKERELAESADPTILHTGARHVSGALVYGTELLNSGIEAAANFVRSNVEEKKADVKVPQQVKDSIIYGRDTAKAIANATSGAIETVVSGATYVVRPFVPVPTKAKNKKSSNEDDDQDVEEQSSVKLYASAVIEGVGAVLNTAMEAKDKIVDQVKKETGNTVAHVLGDEAADVSRDVVATFGHATDIYADFTSMGKGFTKSIAKRAIKRSAMEKMRSWKSDHVEEASSVIRENPSSLEEPTVPQEEQLEIKDNGSIEFKHQEEEHQPSVH